MYDNVRCNYPLPWDHKVGQLFQSKHLDCQLETYEVTGDGRLLFRKAEREWVDEPNSMLGKVVREKSHELVEVSDFEGELVIYDLEDSDSEQDWWYSVRLWFRDGRVKDAIFHKRKSGLDCSPSDDSAGGRGA